jgi:transcriptional regulator with XRE-family HTH domain
MDGWELRRRRRDAGLTLQQVARAAGTAEANVSAYERGTKAPNQRTLRRLVAVIDAGADSVVHRAQLATAPATAAALRLGLRQGWATADLLRLVRQMRSDATHLTRPADRAAFYAEPSTTGDPRWDAMLAGAVDDLAVRDGVPAPEWTRGKALDRFWFVTDELALRAYVFGHSPMALQVRGVMVDPADLEAV